jgi:phosphate:Na+ symporter
LDTKEILFSFLGGLGIFLFGIKYMGDGLQNAAGDRLRNVLDRFTTNPFMGVLAGAFITMIIQSSSATTVLTVALVNAGFMTLRQAIGVIMGANIGTTMTAFIIGIDLGEYALPIIAAGAVLLFFFKNKRINFFGRIVFGFGALFFGLETMSDGLKPLRDLDFFQQMTLSFSETPLLGVVAGTVFTVIVQSSSATIGILQQLYAEGAISLKAALPVLFGDNIGTTITAILASIGASVSARRAALVHVNFNVIGTVIFLAILPLFTRFIAWLEGALNLNPEMAIAFAHGSFNAANTIIQFPFIAVLAWLVTRLVPGEDVTVEAKAVHLNPVFINRSPSIALGQAKEEIKRMGEFALNMVSEAYHFLNDGDRRHAELAAQYEEAIDRLDAEITDYLVQLTGSSMAASESQELNALLNSIRDIERVGDHAENIVELLEARLEKKVKLTQDAIDELNAMFRLTQETLQEALKSLYNNDKKLAVHVLSSEKAIDQMERDLRKSHIQRLNDKLCSGEAGIFFVEIASNLERIGDHSVNIAEAVLGEEEEEVDPDAEAADRLPVL